MWQSKTNSSLLCSFLQRLHWKILTDATSNCRMCIFSQENLSQSFYFLRLLKLHLEAGVLLSNLCIHGSCRKSRPRKAHANIHLTPRCLPLPTHGAFQPRARLQMDSEDGVTQHCGVKKLVNEGIKTSMAVIGRGHSSFLRPETHPELKTNYWFIH